MKKINKVKYISMSICIIIATIIISTTTPVLATTQYVVKQLTAYFIPDETPVTIYVNDKRITSDADGKNIAPVIIDGVMYLPVETMADALGKSVTWYDDSATLSFQNINIDAPGSIIDDNAKLTTTINKNGEVQDKLDYKFTLDSDAVGEWKMFHYYNNLNDFAPAVTPEQHFGWTGNSIYADGTVVLHQDSSEINDDVCKWTKGYFVNPPRMQGVPAYSINTINDKTFMILEWKSGDYARKGTVSYYVFVKVSDVPESIK